MTVEEFWADYSDGLIDSERPDGYSVLRPAVDRGPEDDFAGLVLSGWKTAMSSLLWLHQDSGDPLPTVDSHFIVVDKTGEPAAVIVTETVRVVPFEDVDEEHAKFEGEGDLTLADWQERHWWRFNEECKTVGMEAARDMPVVLQRFRVAHKRES